MVGRAGIVTFVACGSIDGGYLPLSAFAVFMFNMKSNLVWHRPPCCRLSKSLEIYSTNRKPFADETSTNMTGNP